MDSRSPSDPSAGNPPRTLSTLNTHSLFRPGILLVLIFSLVTGAAFADSSPLLVVRSGNGPLGGTDSQITFLSGTSSTGPFPTKFTPAYFTAASSGPAAWIVYPDGAWQSQLAGDTISQWVGPQPMENSAPSSPTALYAVKFNMPSVPPVVTLVIHYCSDNQLGDSLNNELYLNGVAVPGTNSTAGTYSSESVLTVPNIAALLKTGSNVLYFNDVDTGGPSGLLFRAEFYAGNYNWSNYAGEPGVPGPAVGTGTNARFAHPGGIAVDGSGNAYVGDTGNELIRKISPGGDVTDFSGVPVISGTTDSNGSAATYTSPSGVAVDGSGNVYVADEGSDTIREITPGHVVTTIAGSPDVTGTTDTSSTTSALFDSPAAVAVDSSGNVYVADMGNDTIREISTSGTVTTIAGIAGVSGTADATGTSSALFNGPSGIAVDGRGNVYIADTGNHTIRIIPNGGQVTTIAGAPGVSGTSDGYQGAAQFEGPNGLAVDHNGDLFIADGPADTIREMTPDGTVATIGGSPLSSGTIGGAGTAARFNSPAGVAVDESGNVYVADTLNDRISTSSPTAAPFALITPVTSGTESAPVLISYSLPSQALSGSVKLTFDNGGGTPTVVTLNGAGEAPGANTIDFDPTDPANSSIVASVTGTSNNSGNTHYIPPGTYTVTLSYQDQYGDPVQTASATGVQIAYATPAPMFGLPAASSTICSPIPVFYSLPGKALSGSVSLTFSGTGSPIAFGINSSGENEGMTEFSFDPVTPGGSGDIVSSSTTPLPIGVYTVTLAYQDYAGDPIATVSNTNVYVSPVATVAATSVNSYSAQLNGQVLGSYYGTATSVEIESGATSSYGATTPVVESGSNGSSVTVYVNLTGLNRDTTYHYQVVLVDNGVTYYGGDQEFTTTHDDAPSVGSPAVLFVPMLTKPVTFSVHSFATPGNPTDTISITSVGTASEGSVRINDNGASFTYTPERFNGNDSFNIVVGDNFGGSTYTTVELEDPYPSFAGSYQALVSGSAQGYITLTLGAQGTFTGSLKLGNASYAFTGTLGSGNTTITIPRKGLPSLILTLSLNPNGDYGDGTFGYSVTIPGAGVEQGGFIEKSVYSSAFPAPNVGTYTLYINPPSLGGTAQAIVTGTAINGKITAIDVTDGGTGYNTAPTFTIAGGDGKGAGAVAVLSSTGSITSVDVVKPGSKYTNPVTVTVSPPSGLPQGYGWATMKISNLGAVTIAGKLADGTPFTSSGTLNNQLQGYYLNPSSYTEPYIMLYAPLYGSKAPGYLAGTLYIYDNPDSQQFQSSGLTWYKPPQASPQLYKNGFNVSVNINGSIYTAPTASYPISLASGTANAIVSLTNSVSGLNLENTVTIKPSPATGGIFVSGSEDALKITTNPATGVFTGKFTTPGTKVSTPFSGVYFQNQNGGYGFSTGASESGAVEIAPAQ